MLDIKQFAVPPPSPPVFTLVAIGGGLDFIAWTQAPTDVVDDYTIILETTTLSCVADVATMESTVPGSSRTFLFELEGVEEFSNISITITARNNGGEANATGLTQSPPAGRYTIIMTKQHLLDKHLDG